MTHPISPVNEEEIEGEIEKEHKIFFEIGKQLNEIIVQTLSENVVNSNKDIEKMIKSIVKDIKDTIEPYLTSLQNHAEEYDFWGWINPDRHLVYLTHLNAGLKIYTALTGDNAAQVRQKLSELEKEVYDTLNAIYSTIVNEKKDRINIIQKIISKKAKARIKDALIDNNTTICKLKVVSANVQDETIKMLLNIAFENAKNLEKELINFRNEKIEITSVNDLMTFLKKIEKLLELSSVIVIIGWTLEDVDEDFAAETDLQSLADFTDDRLLLLAEDLRGREIDNYEWFMRTCADEELSKYYVNECKSLNS
ncbi:MAG: hypothetical protein QXX36_03870 [Candidatus Rehaiarchaeum fermentans]|nr:hypothetical protein [Candidatus Rehaiarchaeum fermentans]